MTIKDMLNQSARARGPAVAYRYKQRGAWREVSYEAFLAQVHVTAEVLAAQGVGPGDRVAIYLDNMPEWPLAYLAIVGLGATAVPVDARLREQEVSHILRDAEARLLVAGGPQYAIVREVEPHLQRLDTVLLVNGPPDLASSNGSTRYLDYAAEIAAAKEAAASDARAYDRYDPGPADYASFIYTSGTTGRQKGAMLTHGNFCANVEACQRAFDVREEDNFLLVLPLHHALPFTANFLLPIAAGAEISFVESLRTVGENVREVSPTALIGVPLLIEKMYTKILKGLREKRLASLLFATGLRAPVRRGIRAKLGGRLRIIVTGGAPCDPEVLRGFQRLGVPILEGYGLTETAPVLTLNPPSAPRHGTVGVALDNVDLAIDDPNAEGVGEIKARGPNVMAGYYNNPEATEATFRDGWLMTGDLGFLDQDGYLTITGRKKSLIVNREGKNIYPEEVEAQLEKSDFILESLVLGYRQPEDRVGERVGVIVVPDQEALDAEGEQRGRSLSDAEINELLTGEVRRLSRFLADYKRPRKIHVRMGEFEKTSTGKVKRYLYELEATEVEENDE